MTDAFARNPELRDKIGDPEQSFYRRMDLDQIDRLFGQLGLPPAVREPEAVREGGRRALLATRPEGDLWVFAYASLMWDPSIRFAEVIRARLPGHARRFILRETRGGWGDSERPGLMVALDAAPPEAACEGLAFRIPEAEVEAETAILWRRERFAQGFEEALVRIETDVGPLTALTFLADPRSGVIDRDITTAEQARLAATGAGLLGTSLGYLRQFVAQLRRLDIEDPDVTDLLDRAEVQAEKLRKRRR